MKSDGEILPLTGLRFVAAFYVFVFHIHIRWPLTSNPFLGNILGQGAIGMSLFFMLSGFVLAYRYADGQSSFGSYCINRFARIYPIYALTALVTVPWMGISFGDGSFHDLGKGAAQLVLLVTANIFLIQAWFNQFFTHWNDGGSWSISVEAFCYLLLPFLLPLLKQLSKKGLLVTALICLVLGVMPGLSMALFEAPTNRVFYSTPIYRVPEFLVGACIFLLMQGGYAYRRGAMLQGALVIFLFCYIGLFGQTMPMYIGHNWIVLPITAFSIFSLASNKGILAGFLSSKLFVWLGKISYCFYSFQALVILGLISNHTKFVAAMPFLKNNIVLALIAFIILTAISALGYYIVEEPARRWIRHYYKSKVKQSLMVVGKEAA